MIRQVRFENWKSFQDATLHLDPLTILIGTNASGKSNVVDGLEFLSRIPLGITLEEILNGTLALPPLRGGSEWASRRPGHDFCLTTTATVSGSDQDCEHQIAVTTDPKIELLREIFFHVTMNERLSIFSIYEDENLKLRAPKMKRIDYGVGDSNQGSDLPTMPQHNAKWSLVSLPFSVRLRKKIESVVPYGDQLSKIFIFSPQSHLMRGYSQVAEDLRPDGANIAGVLASAESGVDRDLEQVLARYVKRLPDGDIGRVWAERVGRQGSDPMVVDARGLSDGTLRFIGIAVALMTRPAGSLLVIEDVDAGLHPSRAGLLLQMLKEIGRERGVDVLVTTHNPALLDALTPDFVPFVTIAHRDPDTGDSRLTLVEDVAELPRLLAAGRLGTLATSGQLDQALRHGRPG